MIKIEITIPATVTLEDRNAIKNLSDYLFTLVNPCVKEDPEFAVDRIRNQFSNPVEIAEIEIPNIPKNSAAKVIDDAIIAQFPKPTDSSGLPWDSRIHSKTQSKREDGTWKPKRGVSFTDQAKVEKELTGIGTVSTPHSIPLPPPVSGPNVFASTPNPEKPDAISMPTEIDNFPDFMTKIIDLKVSKKLSGTQLSEILKSVGLESIPMVATHPDLIPTIVAKIDALVTV